MADYKKIRYEMNAGIARITLDRPEKRNALDAEVISNLKAALQEAAAAPVRVVALTGAGSDFCSGADLDALRTTFENGPLENISEARAMAELFQALRGHRCPVVAVVKGRALAGGCGLASACDIVLAARSAKFIQSFANIGLVPDSGGTWILPRIAGQARALGMALTGEPIPAEKAESWGLIWKCVDDEALAGDAWALTQKLAAGPTRAIVTELTLAQIQHRRELPTRITQAFQAIAHRHLRTFLGNPAPLKPPLILRLLSPHPTFRRFMARFIGMGVRPEHISM